MIYAVTEKQGERCVLLLVVVVVVDLDVSRLVEGERECVCGV